MERVLVDLTGPQVAAVIMKRVQKRLHGELQAKDSEEEIEQVVSLESAARIGSAHK